MKYFDEEDVIAEYEKQLQKKDNEIERLEENNLSMQGEMARTWKKAEEKDKEIERLNNIINELEKWAKEELEQPNWASCGARCMLDKLQELKGSE